MNPPRFRALASAFALVNNRGDARFSDVALVVCPNVTIRSRLEELKPERGDASVYRTRDLVPAHLMPQLMQGKVLVTNWHVFEPQAMQTGGVSAKVEKRGKPVDVKARITIGKKTTTARGKRYVTLASFTAATADGAMRVIPGTEKYAPNGGLAEVEIVEQKYIESDTALLQRVLGRDVGGKQNILVLNDEAHHAYRIRKDVLKQPVASAEEAVERMRVHLIQAKGRDVMPMNALAENWYFLRNAIESVYKGEYKPEEALPYRIFAEYQRRSECQVASDALLARREVITEPVPQIRTRG